MMAMCFVFFQTNSVYASEDNQTVDILAKTGVEKIEHFIKEYAPQAEVYSIPEIDLLRVNNIDKKWLEKLMDSSEISEQIQYVGHLAILKQEPLLLKQEEKENFEKNEKKFNKSLISDSEMFDKMAWHIDLITNDRESLQKATGENVNIAIIDSGIDKDHPILEGKINLDKALSYVDGSENIKDTNGHGTMVAGVITQVAPDASITPYRVISEDSGDSLWSIQAIIQAVNDESDVINMSLGTYKSMNIDSERMTIEAFERAIDYAEKNNVPVVASSGNESLDLDNYLETDAIKHLPGGISEVVTVSSAHDASLASYSNYGSSIDLCAPGGDLVYIDEMLDLSAWLYCIYPTYMDNGLSTLGVPQGYTYSYGTSLAAPQVTGAIADVIDYYGMSESNRKDAVLYLEDSVMDLGISGKDNEFGYGMLNIANALNMNSDVYRK